MTPCTIHAICRILTYSTLFYFTRNAVHVDCHVCCQACEVPQFQVYEAPPSCSKHSEVPSNCNSSKSSQPMSCSTAAIFGGNQTILVAIIVLLAHLNSSVSIHLVKFTLISSKCTFGDLCAAPKCLCTSVNPEIY